MSSKKQKRELAKKRNKKKKQVIIILGIVFVVAIVGLIIFAAYSERNTRVFTDGRQMVNLMQNGNFNAQLSHGVTRSGSYHEEVANGETIITFITNGASEQGTISGEILTLPSEWDDGCGHNDRLPQTRGPRVDNE